MARSLRPVTATPLVVSNDPAASTWLPQSPVAGDVLEGRASAIGIHAALSHTNTDMVVLAWDMPFVPAALVAELARLLTDGVSAVVPHGPEGLQPVCAAYSRSIIPLLERLIGEGFVKLSMVLAGLPAVRELDLATVARFGDPQTIFFNVNRPDDLVRAEAIARAL